MKNNQLKVKSKLASSRLGVAWFKFYVYWRFPIGFVFAVCNLFMYIQQTDFLAAVLTAGNIVLVLAAYTYMKRLTAEGYTLFWIEIFYESTMLLLLTIWNSYVLTENLLVAIFSAMGPVIVLSPWIILNAIYFKKRKYLFFDQENTLQKSVVNTMESPVVFDEIREKETSKEYNQSTRQDIMNITNNNDNVSKSTYQSKIEKNEPKKRFCKECGSLIDPETKCCSGCGKQYFRGFSKSIIAIIILSVLLVFSGGFNIVELYKSNALYSQIKNGIEEINKKEKALQTQKSELGHVKYENEKLKEINNRYEENVAVVLIPDERSSSPADSIDFDHSYAEYLAKKYYHTFSCSRVDRINDLLSGTSNKIHIYSVQDAKSQGYTACSECH